MNDVIFAFIVTLLAGLSTTIGAIFVFFTDSENKKFLSASLGLSAGVMIYISFMEMMPTAIEYLNTSHTPQKAELLATLGLFAGAAFIGIIDGLVPEDTNPHHGVETDYVDEREIVESEGYDDEHKKKLERIGVLNALAIAVHNFPEGIATFMSALINPSLGIFIGIAIALHNIPEGIAVAIPTYQATGNKKRAIWLTFLSGFAEPVGGVIGYVFLRSFLNETIFALIFAFVSGIMIFISIDELLPASREHDEDHMAIYGFMAGMAIMAATIILLG